MNFTQKTNKIFGLPDIPSQGINCYFAILMHTPSRGQASKCNQNKYDSSPIGFCNRLSLAAPFYLFFFKRLTQRGKNQLVYVAPL